MFAAPAREASRCAERPEHRPASADLFDLTPSDEQKMIVDATQEFAARAIAAGRRRRGRGVRGAGAVLKRSVTELGIPLLGVPESLGGMSSERSATTGVLVAEALAHGDMGLAVACLAPAAVSTALVLWGDAEQQATYLPAFTGDDVPAAALSILEPRAAVRPVHAADDRTPRRPTASSWTG